MSTELKIKWLEEAKKRDYEVYKKDPEEYYTQLKACGVWMKKHREAINRLAHHVWPDFLDAKE